MSTIRIGQNIKGCVVSLCIFIKPKTGLDLAAGSSLFLSNLGFPVSGSLGSFNQTTLPWYLFPFL